MQGLSSKFRGIRKLTKREQKRIDKGSSESNSRRKPREDQLEAQHRSPPMSGLGERRRQSKDLKGQEEIRKTLASKRAISGGKSSTDLTRSQGMRMTTRDSDSATTRPLRGRTVSHGVADLPNSPIAGVRMRMADLVGSDPATRISLHRGGGETEEAGVAEAGQGTKTTLVSGL